MPKINQEEYEVLKELDDKWKYLARNNMYGAKLEAHTSRPYKMTDSHWSNGDMTLELLGGEHLFQFIQWEDEEPHSIQELIHDYEYKTGTFDWATAFQSALHGESEEKEVKDLEWVKAKLKKDHKDGEMARSQIKDGEKIDGIDLNSYWRGRQTANYIVRCYLEDLDEPEVLSQEWIDKHTYYEDEYDFYYADPDELKNLLVPKQEELEVKIQELIEVYKQEDGAYSNPENGWIGGFIEGLKNLLEEEQKYYVVDNEYIPLLQKGHGYVNRASTGLSIFEKGRDNDQFALTEQEIKDYDERYWSFAVKVKEEEE